MDVDTLTEIYVVHTFPESYGAVHLQDNTNSSTKIFISACLDTSMHMQADRLIRNALHYISCIRYVASDVYYMSVLHIEKHAFPSECI